MQADSSPAPDPAASARPSPRRRGGIVVPHQPTRRARWTAALLYGAMASLSKTIRFEWDDPEKHVHFQRTSPIIFATWHNRLAMALVVYRDWIQPFQPQRRLSAMVSASRDGAMLARVLEHFDVLPVRGSSSRRGPQALLELTSVAEQGFDIALTPDGPRGPRYHVQDGVIALAQLTGLRVVPIGYRYTRKSEFKSWDRFQVPWPLAGCRIRLGTALTVPRDATDAERESARAALERELLRLNQD